MKKNILKFAISACLAASALLMMNIPAKAEHVRYEEIGVSYDNQEEIGVGYASKYANGGAGKAYVYAGYEHKITNLKSSNKNIQAKITKTSKTVFNRTEYDWETDKYVPTKEERENSDYEVSFFATKAGTATVTFDVVDKDGKVIHNGVITVTAVKNQRYVNPVKKITYSGKDVWSLPVEKTPKSGKIKVTMAKGFKLVSLEIGTMTSTGERTYKKIKNNQKITLTKSIYYKVVNDSSAEYYDPLLPGTSIRITYKNNKTKATSYDIYTLNLLNPKSQLNKDLAK